MSCENFFREQLKLRGLRLTVQRKLVLEALHDQANPVSAEDVFTLIQSIEPSLDRSTVYRTLDLLKEIGLVQEINSNDRQNYFELCGTRLPHVHMVCQKCGGIFTVDQKVFDSVQLILQKSLGFEAQWTQMTIPGICQGCRTP